MMLERLLRDAIIVSEHSSDTVSIGATVSVRNDGNGDREFTIVGTEEIDIATGKISNESPLGRALVGRKVGEQISVDTPTGSRSYEIVGIT